MVHTRIHVEIAIISHSSKLPLLETVQCNIYRRHSVFKREYGGSFANLMNPNKGKTAVHDRLSFGNMAVISNACVRYSPNHEVSIVFLLLCIVLPSLLCEFVSFICFCHNMTRHTVCVLIPVGICDTCFASFLCPYKGT